MCLSLSDAIAPSRAPVKIVRGDEGSVAALDLGAGRHRLDDVPDLFQGRHTLVPMGLGDPRLLGRQVEIFGIGVRNPGLVPWLPGQPDEETLQGTQRGVERWRAKGSLVRTLVWS